MSLVTPFYGVRNLGKATANAGTVYTAFVEPGQGAGVITALTFAQWVTGATAHTLTVMRPLSAQALPGSTGKRCSTYLTAAAAASQAVINIYNDPGVYTTYSFPGGATPRTANNVIAAGDYVAFQYPDGTWAVDTVASVATLAITLTNNLATGGLAIGAPVWFFGVSTDVNPYDAKAHPAFVLAASSTINFGSEEYPWMTTLGQQEPLLLYVDNATNASVLERLAAGWLNVNGPYASYA